MTSQRPEFDPVNELERDLKKAQLGQLPVGALMKALLASQVLVLVDNDVGTNGTWDGAASPLILPSAAGDPLLAVFTALERLGDWPTRFPNHTFALLTDFRWLLKRMATDVGLVVNPGSSVGLELPPVGVHQLRSEGT